MSKKKSFACFHIIIKKKKKPIKCLFFFIIDEYLHCKSFKYDMLDRNRYLKA